MEPTKPPFIERIKEAVIKLIEGGDDPVRKWDYQTRPDDKTIKTLSILSEMQLDSVAECCFLGEQFSSLMPLKEFAVELAHWSPSKGGKGREQLTATMISTETHVVPMALQQISEKGKEKKKEKEAKETGA